MHTLLMPLHTVRMAVPQGTVQIDMDQQDYLGVLLGDPSSFGSAAGSQALKAAPANKGTCSLRLHLAYIVSDVLKCSADAAVFCMQDLVCWL